MRLVLISTMVMIVFLAACTGTMTGKPLDKTTVNIDSGRQTADSSKQTTDSSTATDTAAPRETTSATSSGATPVTQNADSVVVPIEGAGTCEDSDGGPNTKVSGRTTVTSSTGGTETRTDECNDVILTEYYCTDDGFGSINKKCADSCENGACV